MDDIQTFPDKITLTYGLLCLDFTDTLIWRLRDNPIEGFKDYSIFIRWGQKIGLLTETSANYLLQEAKRRPLEAESVLRRTIELREALYRIIVASIEGHQPRKDDIYLLNTEISEMLQRTVLTYKQGNFEWAWHVSKNDLDQLLWPILHSATGLLTTSELRRIGMCQGDGCGWLFYDNSRNQSRKWCDMGECGNRAKARRFYKKTRSTRAT